MSSGNKFVFHKIEIIFSILLVFGVILSFIAIMHANNNEEVNTGRVVGVTYTNFNNKTKSFDNHDGIDFYNALHNVSLRNGRYKTATYNVRVGNSTVQTPTVSASGVRARYTGDVLPNIKVTTKDYFLFKTHSVSLNVPSQEKLLHYE